MYPRGYQHEPMAYCSTAATHGHTQLGIGIEGLISDMTKEILMTDLCIYLCVCGCLPNNDRQIVGAVILGLNY